MHGTHHKADASTRNFLSVLMSTEVVVQLGLVFSHAMLNIGQSTVVLFDECLLLLGVDLAWAMTEENRRGGQLNTREVEVLACLSQTLPKK